MSLKSVCVIVPNYNHGQFLRVRLESIFNQVYDNFTVILLDDASTDDSHTILEAYRHHPRVGGVFYNQTNSGSPFMQWVKGIQLAQADLIWIAETDDVAEPQFLESMVALANKYPNVALAYSNSDKIDENGQHIEDLFRYMKGEFKRGTHEIRERLCLFNTITNASACLIRTEYAKNAVAGLGELRTCGDWIFYTRVLHHGDLVYCHQILNHYRWHQKSVSFGASKTSSYTTEGVSVVGAIDFRMVRFSARDFFAVIKGWLIKINKVEPSRVPGFLSTLAAAAYRYMRARFELNTEPKK